MIFHQHILIIEKKYLPLGEEPTKRLDNTTITAEAKYFINFNLSRKKLCLSLHYK